LRCGGQLKTKGNARLSTFIAGSNGVDEIFKLFLLAMEAWEGAQLHRREWSASLAGVRGSRIARGNATAWGMAAAGRMGARGMVADCSGREQLSGRAGWEEESVAAGGRSNGASAVAARGGAWAN
jgi:hypothetical protein